MMTIYVIEYTDFMNVFEYLGQHYFTSRQQAEDYLLSKGFKHTHDDNYESEDIGAAIIGLTEKENDE